MRNQQEGKTRMTKKRWRLLAIVLATVMACVWLLWVAGHTVYGYTVQNVSTDTAYKDGYFYVVLQDEGGQMTRCRINVSRTASVKYSDFKKAGQSYSCSLSAETANVHNVRLDTTSFQTTKSSTDGNYVIGSVTLRYVQHGNYRYASWASERPSGGRLGPYVQNADGTVGALSINDDTVYQDTERTAVVTFYVGNIGLITNNKKRYLGTELTVSYARPVYTVNFHDGAGTVYNTQYISCGDGAVSPAAPTRTGHNFSGWNTGFSCITANTEVYPLWTPWRHTVHYKAENASHIPADQTKTYGSLLTLSTQRPVRNGCNFTHWKGPDGQNYTPGGSYGRDQNGGTVTLTAAWEAYLDLNGRLENTDMDSLGECAIVDIYIQGKPAAQNTTDYYRAHPLGTTYEIRNIRAKSGYAYAGVVQGSLSGSIQGLTSVRLKFTRTDYRIRYEANGGTGTMAEQKAIYGTPAALVPNQFVRTGYQFLGWSTDPDAAVSQYAPGQNVTQLARPQQTARLYAVWKKSDASFDTDTLIHDEKMFTGAGELTGGNGTGYDSGHTDSSYARVDSASQYGYFTEYR